MNGLGLRLANASSMTVWLLIHAFIQLYLAFGKFLQVASALAVTANAIGCLVIDTVLMQRQIQGQIHRYHKTRKTGSKRNCRSGMTLPAGSFFYSKELPRPNDGNSSSCKSVHCFMHRCCRCCYSPPQNESFSPASTKKKS